MATHIYSDLEALEILAEGLHKIGALKELRLSRQQHYSGLSYHEEQERNTVEENCKAALRYLVLGEESQEEAE